MLHDTRPGADGAHDAAAHAVGTPVGARAAQVRARALPALGVRLLGVALLATAAGCASVRGPAAVEPVAEPAPPPLPLPVATHEFTILPTEDVVGVVQVVVAGEDDTLPDIARRFNVGYEEIVRANPGVDPWLPGAGREIVVPTRFVLPDAPREGVVVNVAAMRLFYYPKREKGAPQVVVTHPIGIGKVGWRTPEGTTRVISRVADPTWTPPASVRREHLKHGEVLPARVPPGPDNPLGRHMLRLGWTSYLIHGTNKPYGVGMRSSHGCLRLYPEDIARIFEQVPIGTQVRIVNQPYVLGWSGEQLYVQAYGALEDDRRDWKQGPRALVARNARSRAPLWQKLRAHEAEVDWEHAYAATRSPLGVPLAIMRGAAQAPAAVVAGALRVQNVLPEGATWDGRDELRVDERQYAEMLESREPAGGGGSTAAAAPR